VNSLPLSPLPRVEFVDAIRDYVVEWVDAAGALLSRAHRIYEVAGVRRPREEDLLFSVPLGLVQVAIARWRPAQRLTRSIFYNVYRLPDGAVFFSFGRTLGIWRKGAVVVLTGAARPMRCLRGAIAMLPDGTLYLGEYDRNSERRAVRIYRLPAGAVHLEVAYEFPAGAVRHVHGLYLQPGSRRIFCATGDLGKECRLLVTEDGFRTLDTVGMGDESWRAVSVGFLGPKIVYGTDAEFVQNRIYAVDSRSGNRESLADVDGPVYYTARIGPQLLLAVTAEGCPSQPVNQGTLWRVTENFKVQRIASYAKDAWPRQFMFGTFHFALGPGAGRDNQIYAYLHGLSGPDGRTVLVTAPN
jgi:hypothetical protein